MDLLKLKSNKNFPNSRYKLYERLTEGMGIIRFCQNEVHKLLTEEPVAFKRSQVGVDLLPEQFTLRFEDSHTLKSYVWTFEHFCGSLLPSENAVEDIDVVEVCANVANNVILCSDE